MVVLYLIEKRCSMLCMKGEHEKYDINVMDKKKGQICPLQKIFKKKYPLTTN